MKTTNTSKGAQRSRALHRAAMFPVHCSTTESDFPSADAQETPYIIVVVQGVHKMATAGVGVM
jgi:hypothetical protein